MVMLIWLWRNVSDDHAGMHALTLSMQDLTTTRPTMVSRLREAMRDALLKFVNAFLTANPK